MNGLPYPAALPGPIPTPVSQHFWEAVHRGRLELQKCDDCARWIFYPRSQCPHCWSTRLTWHPASGRGTVKSFSIVYRSGHPAWLDSVPYAIALISLDEGPTLLSLIAQTPLALIRVGMRVAVRFVSLGDFVLPMFEGSESELQRESSARAIE